MWYDYYYYGSVHQGGLGRLTRERERRRGKKAQKKGREGGGGGYYMEGKGEERSKVAGKKSLM